MIQKQFFRVFQLFAPDQTFLSETNLKELTNHIHSVKMIQNMK